MDPTLANIAVTITANVAQFAAGMRGAAAAAQSTAAAVQSAGARVEAFAGQVGAAVSAMTAGWVGGQTFGVFERWFNLFAESESTWLRLTAAVRANGEDVGKTLATYRNFAGEMTGLTTVSQVNVAQMLQQAESFGITGAAAERAVKNTVAAQAAGLPVSIRQMTMLEEGNTRMLLRVLPGLRNLKSETDRVTYAQDRLGKMFAVAEAQAQSAGGQVQQLSNAATALSRSFGEVVAEGVKPVVAWLKEGVAWVQGWSGEMKTAVVVMAAAAAAGVAGFATLTAGVLVFGTVLNLSLGGAGILIGAVVTGLALAAGGAAALVSDMGGIGPTFAALKAAALAAWDWLSPVRVALADLWKTVQDVGTQAWAAVKQAAMNAWNTFGLGKATWDQVRAAAVDAVIAIEFGLTHVQDVSNLAWAGIKYYAVAALDTILENIFLVLAGPGILAAWAASYVNWSKLFTSVGEVAKNVFLDMSEYAAKFFTAVKLSIEGKAVNWGALFSHTLGTQFEADVKFTAAGIVLPQLQATEAALKAEFERVKDSVGVSFDVFRAKKLAEFAAAVNNVPTPKPDPKAPPHSWAPAIEKAHAALKSFNAVLVGTGEDFAVLADYADLLGGGVVAPGKGGGRAGGGAVAAALAGGPGDEGIDGQVAQQLPVLRQIRDAVVQQLRKPGLDVQAGMGLG